MFLIDSHCDTPSQILRLRDMARDNEYADVDFPKLRRGGVDGAFFAMYVPAAMDGDADVAFEYAYRLLEVTRASVVANSDVAAFASSEAEAVVNKAAGKFSVFLGLENASPIGESLERLRWFYDQGVRYVTLCHSGNNLVCDSCATVEKRWGGLSPFGRELVAEMNRLGMMVDVSHISDEAFYDVLECSNKPVVATHSCCRALAGHPRNLSDDMIRALAAAGGVIQINFYPLFLDDGFGEVLRKSGIMERGEAVEAEFIADPSNEGKRRAWYGVKEKLMALERPSYKRVVDHIDYVVSLVGVEYVGLGSDFDGIELGQEGLESVEFYPRVLEELTLRGYSQEDISKIASGNLFRVLKA